MPDIFGGINSNSFGGQSIEGSSSQSGYDSFGSLGGDRYEEGALYCKSSLDCGSGFSCVGGQCVKLNSGNVGGNASGPGSCDTEGGGGGGSTCGAAGGGGSSCETPSCDSGGGFDEPLDCCASEVVYKEDANGVVTAGCPEGDDNGSGEIIICNQYCTDYYQANAATRFGCSLLREFGTGVGNTCGSCESCNEDARCQDKLSLGEDAPCWCDKGARCEDCEPCQYQDADNSDYGLCRAYEDRNDAPEDCRECVEVTDPTCDCGITLTGTYKSCKVYGPYINSDPALGLLQLIDSLCEDKCPKCLIELPATTCETQTIYTPVAQYPDATLPPCPAGSTCRVSGTIFVEGQPSFATLFEICPNKQFPGGCLCKPVDCIKH